VNLKTVHQKDGSIAWINVNVALHLAVLDGRGEIIYASLAWDDFGRKKGIIETETL